MVEAVRQGAATAYCIDATEVTKAQYQKFYIASDVNSQDPVCKAAGKQSFSPRDAWSPQDVPGGLAFNLSLPVHYVDWCDAYAYCKWAGKQLCGSVTGGTVAPAQADTASAGAWYNACSKGGASTHPYGDTPVEGKCNSGQDPDAGAGSSATCGSQAQSRSGYGCAQNRDEGIHEVVNGDIGGGYTEILFRGCAGGMLGLYHMTGNVAEWENSCDSDQTDANCRVRGGSYKSGSESALRCDDGRTVKRVPPDTPEGNASLADVGIRCCLF
jgi:formylglycine-generating enzyme required for sulfatase activity